MLRRRNISSRSASDHGSRDYGKLFENQVGEKSVYSSGDKVMVTVNFGGDKTSAKEKAIAAAANIKPSVIIDILDEEGPYKVIEQPKELVDIASDPEGENEEEMFAPRTPEPEGEEGGQEPPRADSRPTEISVSGGPKTPPNEPETEHEDDHRPMSQLNSSTGSSNAAAVMADPEPTPVVALGGKGPQTPPDEPQGYDPFEPTDSPPMSPKTPLAPVTPPQSGINRPSSRQQTSLNAAKTLNNLLAPFLSDSSVLNGGGINGNVHLDDNPVIQPYTRSLTFTFFSHFS